jgi:hypothetical protein
MLILIAIGAMLSYPRPEPWGQPTSNAAGKMRQTPRPHGPRICTGDALRPRQETLT